MLILQWNHYCKRRQNNPYNGSLHRTIRALSSPAIGHWAHVPIDT